MANRVRLWGGKFFFSISGSALVVSLGIKLTGFQGFFCRITFWVGKVQKTEIFKNFDRGLWGVPKLFFWSPMNSGWNSDLFWPKKYFAAPKMTKLAKGLICDQMKKSLFLGLEKYFLGLNRSECHNKTIGDQKKKFGPPLGPLSKFLKISVFWTCPTQNVIRQKNPWNPVSFIPRLTI